MDCRKTNILFKTPEKLSSPYAYSYFVFLDFSDFILFYKIHEVKIKKVKVIIKNHQNWQYFTLFFILFSEAHCLLWPHITKLNQNKTYTQKEEISGGQRKIHSSSCPNKQVRRAVKLLKLMSHQLENWLSPYNCSPPNSWVQAVCFPSAPLQFKQFWSSLSVPKCVTDLSGCQGPTLYILH